MVSVSTRLPRLKINFFYTFRCSYFTLFIFRSYSHFSKMGVSYQRTKRTNKYNFTKIIKWRKNKFFFCFFYNSTYFDMKFYNYYQVTLSPKANNSNSNGIIFYTEQKKNQLQKKKKKQTNFEKYFCKTVCGTFRWNKMTFTS